MNILISCMGYDGGKSGISSYMRSVIQQLKNFQHHFTLIVEADSVNDFKGFDQIVVPQIFSKSLMGMLWHFFILPFYTLSRKYDCILILAANRRYLAFSRIPRIGVVHDLSSYRVSKKYDPLRMFYLNKLQPHLGRSLDSIFAISNSTKADIVKYWKLPNSKINLNYNGLNKLTDPDDRILDKLKLKDYILYVSRIEHPGKNHIGLIKAYENLPIPFKERYKLVFAGSDWSGAEIVKEYARKSPVNSQIIFTGYITDAELSSIYRHASLFVFPSFSEGFGLPLLEAMSVSVPCICANNSSLGEIGGDAVLTFAPSNTQQICELIQFVLSSPEQSSQMIQKGIDRITLFDWKIHTGKLIQACNDHYKKNSCLEIFGIKFVNGRIDEILHLMDNIILKKQRQKIAFINTHYLNTAYENPEQAQRLNRFDYVLPDGSGVYLACKILGYRYRDNLNGTDLLPKLCKLSEERGYSIYFFGSAETVAERAVHNLLKIYPNLKVAGLRNGYFSKKEEPKIIRQINDANPDILVVGFGVILQEKWIEENFEKLNCRIAAAMGGILDVYSGDAPRGHPFLRKVGLEWLQRLCNEPQRLAYRYIIGNPLFLWRVFKSRFFKWE